jgi:hypothetical protein
MYPRHLEKELQDLIKDYPIVTIMGPRQSGKTTLVRHTFPDKPYVNLEAPDIRERALTDPRAFLSQYPKGAILDEIQRAPTLLSYIQVVVDEDEQKGMFILTGSHQIELHEAISQSFAGRTALLNLLPMSLVELEEAGIQMTIDEAILKGGYPRLHKDHLNPSKAYRNYFQTYIERDVRKLINVKDLQQFQKFIGLCAGRIGQVINQEGLANEVGVSSPTIKHWLSILEASFILRRLPPYFENFGKRMIKSPKIYFTDVGLAAYLLGIENLTQLSRDPLRGHLFENLVYLELLKYRLNLGLDSRLYFFRDTAGHEIDFIFQKGHQLIPIEVKASQTFNKEFIKNLVYFQKLDPERFTSGFIIYAGSQEQQINKFHLLNYHHAYKALNHLEEV